MSARAIRTAFAAPFVVTLACGKSDPKPAPAPAGTTAALLLDLAAEKYGQTCAAIESCPTGVACDPAKPYVVDCRAGLELEEVSHIYLGVTSDGNCHARPAACTEASCFESKVTPCPHQELPPLRVAYWSVDRDGDSCAITPRGLAGAPDGPTKTAPCAEGLRDPIVGVYRESVQKCRVLESVPRPLPPGVTSTSNPPEPRYLPCPAE